MADVEVAEDSRDEASFDAEDTTVVDVGYVEHVAVVDVEDTEDTEDFGGLRCGGCGDH